MKPKLCLALALFSMVVICQAIPEELDSGFITDWEKLEQKSAAYVSFFLNNLFLCVMNSALLDSIEPKVYICEFSTKL